MKFHSIGPVSYDSLVDACRDSEYSVLTVHSASSNPFIEHSNVLAFLNACDTNASYRKAIGTTVAHSRDNEVTKSNR